MNKVNITPFIVLFLLALSSTSSRAEDGPGGTSSSGVESSAPAGHSHSQNPPEEKNYGSHEHALGAHTATHYHEDGTKTKQYGEGGSARFVHSSKPGGRPTHSISHTSPVNRVKTKSPKVHK